ncbi:hypothetical protein SAMN05216274_12057, partial [Cryobacterium levicorallinum]
PTLNLETPAYRLNQLLLEAKTPALP